MQAIRTILNEHRSLAAVLHGMLYLVREIRDRGKKPDFNVLGAMVYYIDAVPERFHHPKEDKYLFKLLRIRCSAAGPLLHLLEEEHRVGAEKIRTLEHWDHMRREEKEVLPLAEQHLTPGDWETIDAAFAGHTDPLFGAEAGEEYDNLFRRIVHLAPPPIGVGPMP